MRETNNSCLEHYVILFSCASGRSTLVLGRRESCRIRLKASHWCLVDRHPGVDLRAELRRKHPTDNSTLRNNTQTQPLILSAKQYLLFTTELTAIPLEIPQSSCLVGHTISPPERRS